MPFFLNKSYSFVCYLWMCAIGQCAVRETASVRLYAIGMCIIERVCYHVYVLEISGIVYGIQLCYRCYKCYRVRYRVVCCPEIVSICLCAIRILAIGILRRFVCMLSICVSIETWRAHVQTCAMQICAIGICAIEIVLFRKDFIVLDPTQRTLSNIITTICTVGKGKRFSPISHIDFAYYCNVRYLAKIAFPSQLHVL